MLNNCSGKVGQQSAAAKYAAATAASDFSIEAEKPYAEVLFLTVLFHEYY